MSKQPNRLLVGELIQAMVDHNVSVNDLCRKTGFLKHQIHLVIRGDAAVSQTTYRVLTQACEAAAQDRRDDLPPAKDILS